MLIVWLHNLLITWISRVKGLRKLEINSVVRNANLLISDFSCGINPPMPNLSIFVWLCANHDPQRRRRGPTVKHLSEKLCQNICTPVLKDTILLEVSRWPLKLCNATGDTKKLQIKFKSICKQTNCDSKLLHTTVISILDNLPRHNHVFDVCVCVYVGE